MAATPDPHPDSPPREPAGAPEQTDAAFDGRDNLERAASAAGAPSALASPGTASGAQDERAR